MGATILKTRKEKKEPTKKQLELYEKLLNGPTMTKKQAKEYEKINKWMRKWKV
ncbi:MAG TPA: hypothetical protein VH396_15815 [Chitinophagaceae bacterium]|jgi:hypothetical protein